MNPSTKCHFSVDKIAFSMIVGVVVLSLSGPAWADSTATIENAVDASGAEVETFEDYVSKYHRCFLGLMGKEDVDSPTAILILGIGSAILHSIASTGLWILSCRFDLLKDPTQTSQTGGSELVGTLARFSVYYLIAAIAAAILLRYVCHLELLGSVGFETVEVTGINKHDVDVFFTGLLMWLGTERVGYWLNIPGGPMAQTAQPVVISGDLQLKDPEASTSKS